jgi:hypothetical protein
MVLTRTRARSRTATGAATIVAFILVLVFGSPIYVDWVNKNTNPNTAGGLFLRTLAWPAWSFDSKMPVRDVLAADLKAILLIVFTALFVTMLAGAELSRAQGTLAAFFTGWGAYIFAAALAGILTGLISAHAILFTALQWAAGGAIYGLFVGWIIGLASMTGRRP